ncbi:hypothetical protein NECAME_14502 [Necator americanus]|uniref:non-specific serine/threonine protein kinase n=1 Tax=Necator americanus TaxID=51031 RepID=W2SPR5_NECAM|nr:hypothetical protein NECAME_14502 [Necator americanus]ETN70836.1 hypothetical protein NECAME_14502 [Necator americanus]
MKCSRLRSILSWALMIPHHGQSKGLLFDKMTNLEPRLLTLTRNGLLIIYNKEGKGYFVNVKDAKIMTTKNDHFRTKRQSYSRFVLKLIHASFEEKIHYNPPDVQGLIGHGGYGEIFYAIDVRSREEVAVKVEPKKRKGRTVKRMILEQKVLLRLQGRPHIPKMIASGHDNKINFIGSCRTKRFNKLMLLSVNIGDLKKASPVRRLGRSTVGRILQQAIAGLRDVHLGGYIHRDVKPANMCFGISPQTRHVLILVDFGLVRRYKNLDGTVRPLRSRAGFRGTVRYVSIRVHERVDQGPADDLVSLVYSGWH